MKRLIWTVLATAVSSMSAAYAARARPAVAGRDLGTAARDAALGAVPGGTAVETPGEAARSSRHPVNRS